MVGLGPSKPTPEKGVGSPSNTNNLSKEDQQKLIDDLQKKLHAATKKKSGKHKRSAIGLEDGSSTDEDEEQEEPEKDDAGASQSSASAPKSAMIRRQVLKARKPGE